MSDILFCPIQTTKTPNIFTAVFNNDTCHHYMRFSDTHSPGLGLGESLDEAIETGYRSPL